MDRALGAVGLGWGGVIRLGVGLRRTAWRAKNMGRWVRGAVVFSAALPPLI